MKTAPLEATCAPSQVNADVPRQALAQIIREELQLALTKGSPERDQARAQDIAIAQALNSPENREAYQSASDVVHAALAAGRWTEEDKRTFHDAFVQLTNDQRMEVMQTLAPAINRGEIAVETSGPLF
jgi:Arc/MetJ-type ribon-helix-helix transcriptional regulator